MRVLGITAVFHEPAAALVVEGVAVAAAGEERFSRRKRGKPPVPFSTWELPEQAMSWRLRSDGLSRQAVDAVAYSYDPVLRHAPGGDITTNGWDALRTRFAQGAVTGTDLLGRRGEAVPIGLFGMDAASVPPPTRGGDDVPQQRLHDEMAHRRVYLHPIRWASLGLSLIERCTSPCPVVAAAAPDAVPAAAGVVSTRVTCCTTPHGPSSATPSAPARPGAPRRRPRSSATACGASSTSGTTFWRVIE